MTETHRRDDVKGSTPRTSASTKETDKDAEKEALTPEQLLDYMREGHEPPAGDAIYCLTKAVVVLRAMDGAAADLPPKTDEELEAATKKAAADQEADAKKRRAAAEADAKAEAKTKAA